jgi:hypothetical protein
MINTLAGVVDTCALHQLHISLLNVIGQAGAKSKNEDACRLLRKNNRVVMLSRQSLGVDKAIKQAQTKEGVMARPQRAHTSASAQHTLGQPVLAA